jgi:hypothetical protein
VGCAGEAVAYGGGGPTRADWAAGPDFSRRFKGNFIFEIQMNWDYGKTSRKFTRSLEGIWTWESFLNSSMLLKDFSKIQYAMQ